MNAGKQCFYNCGGKQGQGKCSWCGSDGWCCRKNANNPHWLPTAQSNGCDGTFGGPNKHHCVLKPCSGLTAGKERIILKQVPILEAPYNLDHIKALNYDYRNIITGIENSMDQMDHATLVRSYQIFPIQQLKVIILFSFSTFNVKIPAFHLINILRSSCL